MDRDCVIRIDFIDRLGLGHEVFEILRKHEINLLAMEATPHQGMMIKLRTPPSEKLRLLVQEFKQIEGVTDVSLEDHLLYEKREAELRTILNSVSEGIIAVDQEGRIKHINDVATQILHCKREEVIGRNMEEYFQVEMPLGEIIKTGEPYYLREVKFKRGDRNIHYLTSGVPVTDDQGRIIGAVATVNDYKKVEALVDRVGRQRRLTTFNDIIYQSPKMRKVVETAKTVAKGNSTILLRGESGTGKELFARAIHMESSRALGPFLAVNCAALPGTLLESELFGYEEGAFTGATKGGRKGLFEQANGGTLFLDEIGEISPKVQVSLLRVLQEGTIRRVGGSREISVDVRIIAATHRDLESMIQSGEFREDLYYRLNVIPLRIPPLRERKEDIPLLVQHLIRKISAKLERPEVCLTRESLRVLTEKDWPGNVRQLENFLERLINVMDVEEIDSREAFEWALLNTTNSFPVSGEQLRPEQNQTAADSDLGTVKQQAKTELKHYGDVVQIIVPVPKRRQWPSLKTIIGEVEKQILLKVLEKYPTSRKAGKVLSVSSTTILNKIRSYGIELKSNDNEEDE